MTAKDLGIKVTPTGEKGLFHWLICVLLFSKPVQQEVAGAAFRKLREHKLDTPDALRKAGWQTIVNVLGEAHYVRYDESTATRLLAASEKLQNEYGGRVRNLVRSCETPAQLKKKIQEFNGIGPTGAEIFLREVRPIYFS